MKRLIGKETFGMLLSENTTEATTSLIEEIINLSETDKNPISLFRTLHHTRFHLQAIKVENGLTAEMGKKMCRSCCMSLIQN